jgi:hypothetical protein
MTSERTLVSTYDAMVRIEAGLAHVNFRLGPIHDYCVVFWRQPLVRDSDRAAGATQDQIMWAASEHCVSEAEDVHEVIEWADQQARSRSAMYTLYGVTSVGVEEGLVWFAGVDPTRGPRGPNSERRHPADVDP